MDATRIFMVSAFLLVSIVVYMIFRSGRRKNEVNLKDLYRTSKSKKLSITKSKERLKREKEEFVQYEVNKKIESDEISDDVEITPKINYYSVLENVLEKENNVKGVINDTNKTVYINNIQGEVEDQSITDFNDIEKLLEETRTNGYKFYDKKIDVIDGIGASYRKRLDKVGILTISDFISAAKYTDGLKKINEETGIYTKLLEKWYVKADMLRIQGIRNDQIEKLIQIGITSIKQLASNTPEQLRESLLENNVYSDTPTMSMIKRWIRIAKELEIIDNLRLDV